LENKAVVINKLTISNFDEYTLQQSNILFNTAPNNTSWYNFDVKPAYRGLKQESNYYYKAQFKLETIGNEYYSVNVGNKVDEK